MLITKIFTFDAAHALTKYHGKCENMHGHTYTLEVTVEGEISSDGMVIDFALLKRIVREKVLDKLDHTNLNDLFKNPSTEWVAKWIWDQLGNVPALASVRLYEIKLWETATSCVTHRGD